MQKLFCRLLLGLACALPLAAHCSNPQPSVAFFYGSAPPVKELALYDWVVVDARVAHSDLLRQLKPQTRLFCYLSVGEIEAHELGALDDNLIVGNNPGWSTHVMDVTSEVWHAYLLQQTQVLVTQGCEGLFLDTLDSYQLAFERTAWPHAEKGLVAIANAIGSKFPQLALFLNRGFEILPEVSERIVGVAAESLYRGWDAATKQHRQVTAADRNWLLAQLDTAKALGVAVAVIDYLPAGHSNKLARSVANQIAAKGFAPWVTDLSLRHLGVSHLIHEPRTVAIIYANGEGDFASHDAHVLLGAPLDYLGYLVEPHELATGLPQLVRGVHAGVIIWVEAEEVAATPGGRAAFERWQRRQLDNGHRVVMFGALPDTSADTLARLGVHKVGAIPTATGSTGSVVLVVSALHSGIGDFEAPLPVTVTAHGTALLRSTSTANTPWLAVRRGTAELNPILVGPWGGYALHPFLLRTGHAAQRQWLLNPFEFLAAALDTPQWPVPDTTTENGRRILLSHVDGDGFPSRAEFPGTPLSAEVLLDNVFTAINLPHTVSVIEGEVAQTGLYPDAAPELEAIARSIFALDNVEIASHSFSHPFFWARRAQVSEATTLYGLGLPIKDYSFDLVREIDGSINYINDRLAPANKRTKVFLWSGDAVPSAAAIRRVAGAGLVNVNGGNTRVRNLYASLTNVSSVSRPTDAGYQIYAPVMNENAYTNNWTGPFWGFRKVIETFRHTESPRRLKPLSIYYHFYSGTKRAALAALLEVYEYARAQPNTPLFISEFAERVAGLHNTRLARFAAGTAEQPHAWQVTGLGDLRTLRVPVSLGWPDILRSRNLAGFSDHGNERYLHLSADSVKLHFHARPSAAIRLVSANAPLIKWQLKDNQVQLRLAGHAPLEFSVAATGRCLLQRAGQHSSVTAHSTKNGIHQFKLAEADSTDALLVCR